MELQNSGKRGSFGRPFAIQEEQQLLGQRFLGTAQGFVKLSSHKLQFG
jgi:hypothetical protein